MLSAAQPTDRDVLLLERIARGDSGALGELYDHHATLLYTLILRITRSTSDAQDVLQETLLIVWRRSERYDATLGSPAAWLVRIARNRAIDRWRADGPGARVAGRGGGVAVCSSPPPD